MEYVIPRREQFVAGTLLFTFPFILFSVLPIFTADFWLFV
jgi:hypothetical protein